MKHSTRHTSNNTTARSGVGGQSRSRRPTLRHTRLHTHGHRSRTSRTSTHAHHSTATTNNNNSSGSSSNNTSSTAEDAASKLRANMTNTTSAILSLHTNTNTSGGTSSLDEQDGEEGSGSSSSDSSEDDMRRTHHHHHYNYYYHHHPHRSHTTSSRSVTSDVSTSASDASSERSTHSSASARTEDTDECPYGAAEYYSMNEYDDEEEGGVREEEDMYDDEENNEEEEEEEEHIACVLYRLPRALFLHVCSFLEDKECRVVLELSRTLHAQITSADSIVWRALCLQAWSNKQGFRDFVTQCQARRQYIICNEEIRLFALQQRLLVQYYADHHVALTELYADTQEGDQRRQQQEEHDDNNTNSSKRSMDEAVRSVAEAIDTEHTVSLTTTKQPNTPVAARKSVTIVTHQHSQSSSNDNNEDVCEEKGSMRVCAPHSSHVLADPCNEPHPPHMCVPSGDDGGDNDEGGHVARSRSRTRRSRRRRRRRCPKSRGRSQGRSTTTATTTHHHMNSSNNNKKRGSSGGHHRSHHTRTRHRSSRRRGQACKRPPPASAQRRRRRRRRGRGGHWAGGQKARTQSAASHTRHSHHYYHHYNNKDSSSNSSSEEDMRYYSTPVHQPHRTRTYSSNHTKDKVKRANSMTVTSNNINSAATAGVHHYCYPHRSRSRTHRPANPRKPSQSARRRRRRQAQQRNNNLYNHNHHLTSSSKKKYAACCQVHTATYEAIQCTTVQERTARQLPPCPVRTNGVVPGQAGQSTLHWWQLAPETRQELLLLQRLQAEQTEKKDDEEEEDVVSQLSASAMDADDENEQPMHSHTRSKASSPASSSHHNSTADGNDGAVVSHTQRVMCLRETAMRVTQAASLELLHNNSNASGNPVQDSVQATEAHAKDEAGVKDASTAPLLTLPPMSWKFAYYMARREAKRTRLSIQDLLDGVWLVCFRATGNVHPIYFHPDQSLVIDHALFTFAADADESTRNSNNDDGDNETERTDTRVPATLPTRTRLSVQPTGNTREAARVSEATPLSQEARHVILSSSSSSSSVVLAAEALHEQLSTSGAAPPPTASVRSLDDGSHQFAQRPTTTALTSTASTTATAVPFTSAQLMHEHTPPPPLPTSTSTSSNTRAASAALPSLRYHLVQGGAQLVVHNFPSLQVLRRTCASQTQALSAESAEALVSTSSAPSPSSTQPLPSSLLDRVFAEEPQRSLRLLYGEAHTTSTAAPASGADTVHVHCEAMRDVVQRLKARGGLHVGLSAPRTHNNKCATATSPHSTMTNDAAQVSARIGTDWGWTLSSNFVKIFSVELHTPLFVERLRRIAGLAECDAE